MLSGIDSNIVVVILAAGGSKRMGVPKQLLPWGSETLLVKTVVTALSLKQHSVITVLGANYHLIKKEIDQFPITILKNDIWEKGLGTSIASAMQYVMTHNPETKGILFVLADQPFINSNYLKMMIEAFQKNKKGIIATAYENEKKGVPVLFDKHYFQSLSKLNDDIGAKHILKANESHIKTLITPVKNVDLDTKIDYEKYHKLNFKD